MLSSVHVTGPAFEISTSPQSSTSSSTFTRIFTPSFPSSKKPFEIISPRQRLAPSHETSPRTEPSRIQTLGDAPLPPPRALELTTSSSSQTQFSTSKSEILRHVNTDAISFAFKNCFSRRARTSLKPTLRASTIQFSYHCLTTNSKTAIGAPRINRREQLAEFHPGLVLRLRQHQARPSRPDGSRERRDAGASRELG